MTSHRESQHPGHAGPFFVVEDVDTVQVEDIEDKSNLHAIGSHRESQHPSHRGSQNPGHAGPFFVVEDVDTVQVEDIIIPVEEVGDGDVEISVGVDGMMEASSAGQWHHVRVSPSQPSPPSPSQPTSPPQHHPPSHPRLPAEGPGQTGGSRAIMEDVTIA